MSLFKERLNQLEELAIFYIKNKLDEKESYELEINGLGYKAFKRNDKYWIGDNQAFPHQANELKDIEFDTIIEIADAIMEKPL